MSEILWNQNKFKQSSNYFSQFKNPFLLHPNFSNFFASLKWNSHLVSSQVFENMFGNMWNHLRVIGIASIDFIKYIVFELHAGVLEHVLAGILFLCNFLNLHLALFLNEYVLSVLHLHAFAPLKEGFTLYGLVESERGAYHHVFAISKHVRPVLEENSIVLHVLIWRDIFFVASGFVVPVGLMG